MDGTVHQNLKKESSSLTSDVAETFFTKVIVFIIGLITGIITARILGPHDRGILSLTTNGSATLADVAKLGLAQANIYYMRKEKVDPATLASNALFTALALGCGMMAITYMAREGLVASVLRGLDTTHLLMILPVIPLLLAESYTFAIFQGLGRFDLFNRRQLIAAVLSLSLMFFALVVLDYGLVGAIITFVAVKAVMDLWVIFTLHRLCPLPLAFDLRITGKLLRFGLKSHLQTLATHLHFRADLFMVAYFLNPAEVAFYAIATRLAELLLYIPNSMGLVLYPRLAGSADEKRENLILVVLRHTFLINLVAAVIGFLLGPLLITIWYGEAYAPAGRPFLYLLPGLLMMSLFFMLTRNFTSQNRQEVNILASGVALLLNIGLNLIFIPRLGVLGAAVSTSLSYSLSTLILFGFFLKESGKSIREIFMFRSGELRVYARVAEQVWSAARALRRV